VFENRFLQTFFAVGAGAVLVFGTLILLTSTAPWGPHPEIAGDPSTPDAAPGAMTETVAANDASSPRADATETGSTATEPDEGSALAATGLPLDQDAADVASASNDAQPAENEGASPESAALDDGTSASPDAGDQAALSAEPVAMPSEPETPIAEDKTESATAKTAEALSSMPPRAIASAKSEEATDDLADVLASLPAAPPAPAASVASEKPDAATIKASGVVASPRSAPAVAAVASPSSVAPKRKPAETPKEALLPAPRQDKPLKPQEPKPDVARKEDVQPRAKGAWHAMALAPADKPVLKAATARPGSAAYASKVWAQLARHKPRAGQRGSTSVSFAIGENGALRGVRVARSSGNVRIDQLALATVRGAAPFAPPASGAASYTIRIDFQ
jgi:protein TonB